MMANARPGSRLLVIARGAEDYGVATELRTISAALIARRWSVTLYSIGKGAFMRDMVVGVGALAVVDPHVPQRFVRGRAGVLPAYARMAAGSVRLVTGLRDHLKRHRYDAVAFCEPGLVLPVALAVAGLGIPSFWLMPNAVSDRYPGDLNRRLYAAAFRMSGMVPVANSRFTQSTLGRAGAGSACMALGVEPAPFLAPRQRDDPLAGIVPADSIRLLVMARLVPFKGQGRLLDAMLSDRAFDGVHMILCGGPLGTPYEADLRRSAESRGAGHRLHLLGPTDDAVSFLRAADVVASVRTTPEPFGLAIVEAMMSGKPVLAHAAGGPADIVLDGRTGWLLGDMEMPAIVHGLSRMLADRGRWSEMGVAGRSRALAHFTAEAMTDRLLAIFSRHGVPGCAPAAGAAGAVPMVARPVKA